MILELRDRPREVDKKDRAKKDKKGSREDVEDETDKNERQAHHMEVLNRKVTEVYELTIGENESNIDAIPMLTQVYFKLV